MLLQFYLAKMGLETRVHQGVEHGNEKRSCPRKAPRHQVDSERYIDESLHWQNDQRTCYDQTRNKIYIPRLKIKNEIHLSKFSNYIYFLKKISYQC